MMMVVVVMAGWRRDGIAGRRIVTRVVARTGEFLVVRHEEAAVIVLRVMPQQANVIEGRAGGQRGGRG